MHWIPRECPVDDEYLWKVVFGADDLVECGAKDGGKNIKITRRTCIAEIFLEHPNNLILNYNFIINLYNVEQYLLFPHNTTFVQRSPKATMNANGGSISTSNCIFSVNKAKIRIITCFNYPLTYEWWKWY